MLPLVGSTITPPGFNKPLRSASKIISKAGRSFDEPPGLVVSVLTARIHERFSLSISLGIITIGVLPIRSSTLDAMDVPLSLSGLLGMVDLLCTACATCKQFHSNA